MNGRFFVHEGELFFTCTKKGICCYQFFNFLAEEVLEQSRNFVINPIFYFWDEEWIYSVYDKDIVDRVFTRVPMTPQLRFRIKKIAEEEGLPLHAKNVFKDRMVNFSFVSTFDSFSGCPYLSDGLCSIHDNRPFACRIYPVIFANIVISVDDNVIPLSSQCKNCDGINAYSSSEGEVRLSDVKREAQVKLLEDTKISKKITAKVFAALKRHGVFEEVMANYILDDIRTLGYGGDIQAFNVYVYKAFVEGFFDREEEKRMFINNQIQAVEREITRLSVQENPRWQTESALHTLGLIRKALEDLSS